MSFFEIINPFFWRLRILAKKNEAITNKKRFRSLGKIMLSRKKK
jgi:hypothetical protein